MSDTNKEVKMQVAPTFVCNVMSVKKRSGETAAFDAKKIYNAIKKAACATNEISDEYVAQITNEVLNDLDNNFMGRTPSVEEIQDIVIRKLMDSHSYKTAEAYIIYRQKHSEIRNANVDAIEIIESYVGGSNWRIKENANIGYSIGGLILHTSERVTAEYWLNMFPQEIADAHRSAAIHIHDLGWLTGYCAGWSLRELLYEGFNGVPGYLQCEPAKH
ncbi:MAG: ribonucleoside triphosphate reductase, partial [Alphaproteobacteria bacterium]|nr:ribonucleoside triphosphate reductase [Alphaproteobacteria bacterium]